MYEAITAGEKDYTALVTKMKAAKIDYVYLGGYHTEAGLIIRQMRQQGMKTILIGGDSLVSNEFWSITGELGEGTLMTFAPDPRKNPIAAQSRQKNEKRRTRSTQKDMSFIPIWPSKSGSRQPKKRAR